MAHIRGKEHPLRDIFSDQFAFSIPPFQRPYSWKSEHANALINDLISFMREADSVNNLPPYFLGSIVLIKKEELPDAEIVDGQQRLTTLTILLSVLRELASSQDKKNLTKFIYEEGNSIADTSNRYRLTLRDRDTEFFQSNIQHEGGIQLLKKLGSAALSDSQKNIQTNALLLLEIAQTLSEHERTHLAQAIIRRCYLVEISTSDLESAYNVFSILNDRGLNISHADILKAQVIGKIPSKQRNRYNTKWEDAEEQLGDINFKRLFNHLNIIYSSGNDRRHTESLLTQFRENVYPTASPTLSSAQFIDEIFLPHAKALAIINHANYKHTKDAKKINNLINLHKKISDHIMYYRSYPISEWIAIAIHYMSLHLNEPDLISRFLTELERLRIVLSLQMEPMHGRRFREVTARYDQLLYAIRNGDNLYAPESPLQITPSEKTSCIEILNGDVYHLELAKYILLRLDHALSAATEPNYDYSDITIEHVLPQKPRENSVWITTFPDKAERAKYVNRLGNLLLLSRSKNSEANNYDFAEKKKKIFYITKRNLFFCTYNPSPARR